MTQKNKSLLYKGVNLAGAEFGEGSLPGTHDKDYTYPTHDEIDYYMGKKMNFFRLPFRWERLQPKQKGSFDTTNANNIADFVSYATSKGATVLLDPHNYARYYGNIIGDSSNSVPNGSFADFWSKLAKLYKDNSKVIFGLMNEPNNMATETWLSSANAAIKAIRSIGATNLILVPGNGWTGAWSWCDTSSGGNNAYYGTNNATAMLKIKDPLNNYAFEVHQYLDGDRSGTHTDCQSPTIGSESLTAFTNWLRTNNKKGFLGEFSGGGNSTCASAVDDMLTYMEKNSDVWLGWSYWAGGPWWPGPCLEPKNGVDSDQMPPLLKHL